MKNIISSGLAACTLAAFALATTSCVVVDENGNVTNPSASAPSAPGQGAPPDLRTKPNGDIEVVFESGCVAIFDRYGNLKMGGRNCDDVDLHRAREAVRAHLAEQRADFLDV